MRSVSLLSGPDENVIDLSVFGQAQNVLHILGNVICQKRPASCSLDHGFCLLGSVLVHDWNELGVHKAWTHTRHSDVLTLWNVADLIKEKKKIY